MLAGQVMRGRSASTLVMLKEQEFWLPLSSVEK
jgi:hypothetical protein